MPYFCSIIDYVLPVECLLIACAHDMSQALAAGCMGRMIPAANAWAGPLSRKTAEKYKIRHWNSEILKLRKIVKQMSKNDLKR